MMRYFLGSFLLLFWLGSFAQDTLTVMHYNLLYYGEITGFCNNSNNSLEMKDPHLRTILNEVQPDIFTVNELSQNETVHDHLLGNVRMALPSKDFRRAASSNVSNSGIVNMLYYDAQKLRLKAQYTAQTYVRDIDVYELYYYSNDLEQGDTAFVVCAVAHLKAGNSSGDANARKIMAENTLRFLETRFAFSNVLFMGDFNFYTGYEQGFQIMMNYENPNMRFIDPIGQIGDWNNNSFYAGIHTQSTNTASGNCKSSGGLDDRFDFILISDEVRFGTQSLRYIQESYKAVGQDGQRFNGTINGAPQNLTVSPEVADALYNFSDHLPVTLKMRVDKILDIPVTFSRDFYAVINPNPVVDNALLGCYMSASGSLTTQIFDLGGNLIDSRTYFLEAGRQTVQLETSHLSSGFYLLQLTDNRQRKETIKLLKR